MRKNIVKVTTITETQVHLDTLRRTLKLPKWGMLELLNESGQVVPCVVRWKDNGPRVVIRNTMQVTR